MSISGVLLNHPKQIEQFSVPGFLVPKNYHPANWNRSSLKGIVQTENLKADSIILFGNQGVFIADSVMGGITPFMNGDFPEAARKRRTNQVIIDKKFGRLLAATNSGLFSCNINSSIWQEIHLPENEDELRKILILPNEFVVISESAFYTSEIKKELQFKRLVPGKKDRVTSKPLFSVFFELHDGSIWGLPGRLIWDAAGIVLFFLCVSAFYIWYYPKKWKRRYKRKQRRASYREKKSYSFLFRYHKKLGWYFAILLIVIFVTGAFLRPPLLITIARGKVNKKWYPAIENKNPWHHKIRNAFYDSEKDQLVLDCGDGIWAGKLGKSFEKQKLPIRIFAMGATVFEEEKPGIWLLGSFGGLQRYHVAQHKTESLLQIEETPRRGGPGSLLVTSFIQIPDNGNYVLGHYKGLCDLKGNPVPKILEVPQFIKDNYKMPLWNFLFELHNARIFRGWIGGFYMLIIPLGGILGTLILLSGVFDYWFVKRKKKK